MDAEQKRLGNLNENNIKDNIVIYLWTIFIIHATFEKSLIRTLRMYKSTSFTIFSNFIFALMVIKNSALYVFQANRRSQPGLSMEVFFTCNFLHVYSPLSSEFSSHFFLDMSSSQTCHSQPGWWVKVCIID